MSPLVLNVAMAAAGEPNRISIKESSREATLEVSLVYPIQTVLDLFETSSDSENVVQDVASHHFQIDVRRGLIARSATFRVKEGGKRCMPLGSVKIISVENDTYPVRIDLRCDFVVKDKVERFENQIDVPSTNARCFLRSKAGDCIVLLRWEEKAAAERVQEENANAVAFVATCIDSQGKVPNIHPLVSTIQPGKATPLKKWIGEASINSDYGSPSIGTKQRFPVSKHASHEAEKQAECESTLKVSSEDKSLPATVRIEFAAKGPGVDVTITANVVVERLPSYYLAESEDGRFGLIVKADKPRSNNPQ